MPGGLQGGNTTSPTLQHGGDELTMLPVATPELPIIVLGVLHKIVHLVYLKCIKVRLELG